MSKICFVVIGFGLKTDYRTGRQLDLDKTYEFLIKPVFDDLNITCFRACDIPHSGVIDLPMYENILKADIVVADISTLNANAIYELGIRHALRPRSTIVIAEKELPFPFDLNHILISSYEHLGKDVGAAEVRRFSAELKKLVKEVLDTPKVDSPVYTFLPELTPPEFSNKEKAEIKAAVDTGQDDSVATLVKEAEALKNEKKYKECLEKLEQAKERDPNNPFIVQRIALTVYKSGLPDTITALKEALLILQPLMPASTNDPETLGLCGAINKRLHEETGLDMYLEKARNFYERGFIISKDYYNGINFAYLLLVTASVAVTEKDCIADTTNAARVRKKVQELCKTHINQENFSQLPDKIWILLTLAEIAFIESGQAEADKYLAAAKAEGAKPFELDSYFTQKSKIEKVIEKIKCL
jgi:tetratricopeptide (TPR) repeat protein